MAFENLKSTGIKYVLTKLKDYFLQIKDAVKSVNGIEPDATGDITVSSVPYAQNLESESSHRNAQTFIQRTAGGDSSVDSGDAWLMVLKGNNEHTGYTAESIDMTVTGDGITATIDRDTFVSVVTESGTTTLTYTTAWSADPATYGITVTGTPVSGNTIVVVYVKEVRGTIVVTDPSKFIATGWNLFNYTEGYARVAKYEFGYRIDGTYTALKYSATEDGTKTDITVNDHMFDITADGYVWVTGGNSTDTAIYPVWEDWTEGHDGDFEAYNATEIDIATAIATAFPYGLMKAGNTVDELDLNLGQAISRVERLAYSAENLATAENSGREYEYDEDYIYLARASAQTSEVTIDGSFTTNDHGIEYFTGITVPIHAEFLYGNNLKNKLEREVLTLSSQTLTSAQQAQVQTNIDVPSNADAVHKTGDENIAGIKSFTSAAGVSILSNGSRYRQYEFKNASGNKIGSVIADSGAGSASNIYAPSCGFIQMSGKATADTQNTGFYEMYLTPPCEKGLAQNKTYTFITTKNLANNLTTTDEGFALDARQGKALNDVLSVLSGRIAFLNAESAKTFEMTVPNNAAFLAIANSNATGIHGIYHIGATSGGAVTNTVIGTAAGITATTATNKVTFDIGDTARPMSFAVILVRGTMPSI